ncbi:TonB-dependent receptor [Sphingomonas sp. AP4-R1]|uniref:TonB-dependent receptor plug domain-containing protein n=1 Tax=Sphingomonas sp. AP4-R1 TaxID=2735134 RepID=UPI0014935F3D|nr:TonB-dependent receptor [Sphingomonas sp. AP4-R1]QJU60118.1 TonB-dependent receptor [Sphingomonas sp. AP4-R1]
MKGFLEGRRLRVALLLGAGLNTMIFTDPVLAQASASNPAPPAAPDASATTLPPSPPASPSEADVAEIVVTGSSIRGVPPTGSQLIQLSADAVVNTGATTTQELLSNVPQLGTFNTAVRPDQRSNGIISTAPNIRGIGQAQTLVLINGHRLVGVGQLQNIPDPSIVPPSAIQRVEIVADGASSVYGSDGISGVVNVITRKDYEGLETSFRVGYGDHYSTLNANAVAGHKWGTGGVMVSAEYTKNSRIANKDRDYLTEDFSAVGGRDNRVIGTQCTPGTYRYNTSATGGATGDYIQFGTGALNPRCSNFNDGDIYPKQERLSFFGSGHQDVNDTIDLFGDAFYSRTTSDALRPSGGLYTSGVITRASPFFPAGIPANVPSITAYYNVNRITGIPERDSQDISVYGGTVGANVKLPREFVWTTYVTGSRSKTDLHEGSFSSIANSALINATTAATAIDPFGNGTSDQTRITLADWEQRYFSKQYIWEINSKVDGRLFTLPGGDVKIAVGGVYRQESYDGLFLNGRIGFREGVGAQAGLRKVYSGFGELFIPIFGDSNATTMLHRLDISLSGRYDHYNDFGSTKNPKIGVNWSPVGGFTLRGSYSTSFHAPALPDLFGPDTRAGYLTNGLLPPGMPVGSVPGGIFIAGGNPDLDAEKSKSYSLGFDFQPESIRGLHASLTYYNVRFKGRVAFPNSAFFYVDPAFNPYFVSNIVCASGSYPTGSNCVSRPIDKATVYNLVKNLPLQGFPNPVNSAADLPDIYSVTILRRANLGQINTDGLDFDVGYQFDTRFGQIGTQVQGNYVINYDQSGAPGSAFVDQFNFGQQPFKARAQVSLKSGPFIGVVTVNYTSKYKNQYNLATGALGVEKIASYTTADLHFGYQFPQGGILSGSEIDLDVSNLFDQDPPFIRSATGYGIGDVIGRVVSVAVRKKF